MFYAKIRCMDVEKLEIKDVNKEVVEDLIYLCIPPDKKDDPFFIEGAKVKRRWANKALEKYGSIALRDCCVLDKFMCLFGCFGVCGGYGEKGENVEERRSC